MTIPNFPTTEKGASTRDRIVRTSAELILHDGVANTTLADVQSAARVSASQIYHYFGSKAGLVGAVIDLHGRIRAEEAGASLVHPSSEGLHLWAERAINIQIERGFVGGCELGSLASELAETSDAVRGELATAFDRWEKPITEALHQMQADGCLSSEADPNELALALVAALQGGTLLSQLRRDARPLRAALDAALRNVESYFVE